MLGVQSGVVLAFNLAHLIIGIRARRNSRCRPQAAFIYRAASDESGIGWCATEQDRLTYTRPALLCSVMSGVNELARNHFRRSFL